MNCRNNNALMLIIVSLLIITLFSPHIINANAQGNEPKVYIKLYVDDSYKYVLEEVRVVFNTSVGGWPLNLWNDIASKLFTSSFGVDNRLKNLLQNELNKIDPEAKVDSVNIYTDTITGFKKLGSDYHELVIRVWITGVVTKGSVISPYTVDMRFLQVNPLNLLNKLGISDLPKVSLTYNYKEPINKWKRTSVSSSSILPWSNPIPSLYDTQKGTLTLGDNNFNAEIDLQFIAPPTAVYLGAGDKNVYYYSFGDVGALLLIAIIIAIVIITLYKWRMS